MSSHPDRVVTNVSRRGTDTDRGTCRGANETTRSAKTGHGRDDAGDDGVGGSLGLSSSGTVVGGGSGVAVGLPRLADGLDGQNGL
jgi:hypothetical protein